MRGGSIGTRGATPTSRSAAQGSECHPMRRVGVAFVRDAPATCIPGKRVMTTVDLEQYLRGSGQKPTLIKHPLLWVGVALVGMFVLAAHQGDQLAIGETGGGGQGGACNQVQ